MTIDAVACQWIAVSERLPEQYKEVIVFAKKEDEAVFTAMHFGRGDWVRSSSNRNAPIDDFYGDGKIDVTHWMPLPTPPEAVRKVARSIKTVSMQGVISAGAGHALQTEAQAK